MSTTPSESVRPAAAVPAALPRVGRLDRWLAAASAALVTCSFMPLAARWGWAFDLTTHFRLQYLVGALLLAGVLAARRHLAWCPPLLAGAVVSAFPLAPYLPRLEAAPAVADVASPPSGVTAVTANLWIHNTAYERFLDVVNEAMPDVLVLVEYTREWSAVLETALETSYPYRLHAPRGDAFGIALYSRYPLEDDRMLDLLGADAVEARVAAPQGSFRVVGVHLSAPKTPLRAERRNRQLAALAELRATIDEPLLMIGDYNVTPFSPYFTDWLAQTGLTDAAAGRGPPITWPAFFPLLGIPIDHALVGPELAVTDYRRLPAFGSDHYPILIRFEVDEVDRREPR